MNHKLIAFIQRPFVRNVIKVATGTAAAQAIAMVFAPFITRLYGPEVFGLQSVFLSIITLLSTIAAMGYPIAIVLPKKDEDALGLVRLSIYIGAVMALLMTVVIYLYSSVLFGLLRIDSLSDYAYLIPIAMIVSVLSAVLSQWLIRKSAFGLLARFSVFTSLWINSIKAGMGLAYPTAIVLIVTNLLGTLSATGLAYLGWKRQNKKQKKEMLDSSTLTSFGLAKKYSDFPLLRVPQNLINAASQALPLFLLASYFGASTSGQYAIALSVLGVPASLIGNSVMSVFYPRVNKAIQDNENVQSLIVRATTSMAMAGILPFVTIMLSGPYIFKIVFGEEWGMAGVYAQCLAPWIFLQYINKPAVSAIPALGLQGGLLIYEIFSTSTKILALWLGISIYNDSIMAVALFSLFGSVAYIWLILWVLRQSKGKVSERK